MAKSVITVYEPLEALGEMRDYWKSYVEFYERYWQAPSTPHSVWFGEDYENFRRSLSEHLNIEQGATEDCFFIKDEAGQYFVCPLGSEVTMHVMGAENHIPAEWFLAFSGEERKLFNANTGFGAIHSGGIYYDTTISQALQRLKEAGDLVDDALRTKALRVGVSQRVEKIQYGIRHLRAWLTGFDPAGKLVLNYGEICSFIQSYTMENEHSVKDIWDILSLLSLDKIEEAELAFKVMSEKWDDISRKASGEADNTPLQ